MNSIFGIGLPELFFIAIIALIVLGPERLPGAIREVAKFLKQVRALGNELTSQFSEELAFLDEMNPRRIIEEATRPEQDQKEKPTAKTSTKPKSTTAKTSTSNAAKPKAATPKPAASTTAKSTTAKTTTAKAESTKAAAHNSKEAVADEAQSDEAQSDEAVADKAQTDGAQSDEAQSTTTPAGAADAAKVEAPPKTGQTVGSATAQNANFESPNGKVEAETENSIAPPKLMHAIEQDAVEQDAVEQDAVEQDAVEQDAVEQDAGKNGDSPAVRAAPTPTASPATANRSSITNGVDSAKANEAPPAVEADAAPAEKQV